VLARLWELSKAWAFVEALLVCSSFSILGETDRHASVLIEIIQELPDLAGNIISDLHVAALMREQKLFFPALTCGWCTKLPVHANSMDQDV
jgi:predicted nucleic acid-binding protein